MKRAFNYYIFLMAAIIICDKLDDHKVKSLNLLFIHKLLNKRIHSYEFLLPQLTLLVHFA